MHYHGSMIPSMAIWYSGQESNITLSRAHYQDYCCNLYVGRIQNIAPSLQQAQYIDAGLVVASSSLCVLSITGQDWLCRHMQGCLAKWQRSMEHGTQARAFHATPDEGPGTEVRACAIPPVTQLEVQLTVCTFARIFIFVNGINSTTDDGYIMKSPYK